MHRTKCVYESNVIGVDEVIRQRGLKVKRRAAVTKTDVLAASSLSASEPSVQAIHRRLDRSHSVAICDVRERKRRRRTSLLMRIVAYTVTAVTQYIE